MVKFRQLIRPGQHGRDVRAVKNAMRHMHVEGYGSMGHDNFAGSAFVHCIKHVQKNHGLKQDGIYGKSTHAVIAPHFNSWDASLYRSAVLRPNSLPNPPMPPVTDLTAQRAAQELLVALTRKQYHADNSGDLYDIQRTAKGLPVWSPLGYWVHLDKRPLEAILWLISKEFHIGTYALCSDHHVLDGRHGHNGGHAVDISSINGVGISSQSAQARTNTLKVATLLHHNMPVTLKPWQLICGGYGNMRDSGISDETIPNTSYYGSATMQAHTNHIHLGYYGD